MEGNRPGAALIKGASVSETEFVDAAVASLGPEMAKALDGGWLIVDGARPRAEFVRHVEIEGKLRCIKIIVEMANVEVTP